MSLSHSLSLLSTHAAASLECFKIQQQREKDDLFKIQQQREKDELLKIQQQRQKDELLKIQQENRLKNVVGTDVLMQSYV